MVKAIREFESPILRHLTSCTFNRLPKNEIILGKHVGTAMSKFKHTLFPYLIGFLALLLTFLSYFSTRQSIDFYNVTRFKNLTSEVRESVAYRMQTYINALNQTKSMVTIFPDFSREEFRLYVQNLNFVKLYPGLLGIGWAQRVSGKELAHHQQDIRKKGFTDYAVWPLGQRTENFPIVMLEPFDWRNKRAFGYDMYTDDIRKSAMDRAWITGKAAATSKVVLVQETSKEVQPGFLIYVPVYAKTFKNHSGQADNLVGFIYSPFRTKDLFEGIFENTRISRLIDFEVFMGDKISDDNLVYNSDAIPVYKEKPPRKFSRRLHMKVAGQEWIILTQARPHFFQDSYDWIPSLILILGLFCSGLIFWAFFSYQKHSQAMEKIAYENSELYSKAQEAVLVRDEFMSIASHELKTPLTSLKLHIQNLNRQVTKGGLESVDIEKLKKMTSVTNTQIGRIAHLIENLLDVSRINSGKLALNKELIDVVEVMKETIERIGPQIESYSTELNLQSPDTIHGEFDRLRLEQVVVNLVTNAAKYGNKKPVTLRLKDQDNQLIIEVIDQGMGISEQDRQRIFSRFERIEASAKEISGLGLGLYITKQIVDAHGGTISVDSVLNQGSTFRVVLPKS
jgi:two-component system, OmpR family, sensor kinase